MAANKKLLVLPGDGIGPEATRQVMRVVDWFDKNRAVHFDIKEGLVGGAAYDAHKVPVTDETVADAMAADAVLFGAVGGPQWDDLPFAVKPERGLLRLRKDMDLYANLRPAIVFPADGRGVQPPARTGSRPGHDDRARAHRRHLFRRATRHRDARRTVPAGESTTQVYTTPEIQRVARVAFDSGGETRGASVCSVEKANVMESGQLWREEVQSGTRRGISG